jgi:predicted small lipoprotein YifL
MALFAFGVAGCGVRGSLEAPPEAKADRTAAAESGQGKPEGAAPKPHKDFILDGLIR